MTFKLVLRGRKSKTKDLRPKIYLLDRVYIPKSAIQMQLAKKYYDRRVYYQKGCDRCPVFKDGDRFCDICAGCDNFKGRFVTYEVVEIGNMDYVAFPAGSIKTVLKSLKLKANDFNVQDNRCDNRAKYPLKFTSKLYDGTQTINGYPVANQKQIVRDFSLLKRGLIEAPARSGKTVVATAIYCGAGRTTLYMAHEKQLLLQFYKTILKFTNLRELRQKTGQKIVGIIEKDSDWLEDWDLVLVNNQKFITTMGIERIRKHVIKRFGQLMCDECLPDDSLILTSKGIKKIQDVTTNDEVLSYNHANKTLEFKKVTYKWNNIEAKPMVCIKHENGTFECSEDHLLWCVNKNDYIKAANLTNEDIILFDNSF